MDDSNQNPNPNPQPQPRKALLLSGGGSTTPLWPGLAERYDLVFWSQAQAQQAAGMGVPAPALRWIGQWLDGDALERAETLAARLITRVVNAEAQIRAVFEAAYGDGAPEPLRGEAAMNWWPGLVMQNLKEMIPALVALEKMAAHIPLAGAVTHEDVSGAFRLLTAFVRARGLPVIHVPRAPCHLLPEGGPDIHRETRADWIAAGGPAVADFYARGNHPVDHIWQTGVPAWDSHYHGSIPGKAEARQVLHLKPDRRVIVYAATWWQTTALRGAFEAEIKAGFESVIAAAQAMSAQLVVKIHPNDHADHERAYVDAVDKAGLEGMVTRHHLTYVLSAADVLVAQGPSNICLEAAILGLPSCYIRTEGFDFATPLPARCWPEAVQVTAAIEQALAVPAEAWGEFVRAYNVAHESGDATERTLAFVQAVVG